ncbi:MAG: TolC family protein [Candidatus Gastranaerophilales bacterium]|nr:TolC family protein [Candidatus Gastranaerophilales bacterium]
MFKKVFAAFALFSITVLPSFAIQEINKGDVLNLEQCIEIALRNSPNIAKAKAQIKIQEANVGQAKSAWTPSIGVGTGFNGSNTRRGSHSSSDHYFGVDASISQMIYDFGKTNASINTQKFNLMAAKYELDYTTLETVYNVKEAYYGVLAAKANRDVQVQNVEINERYYDQIKAYFDEGIRSRIDFVNADVNLSNAKYDLLSAQDNYCDAMVKLNKALYVTNNPDYAIAPLEKFNIYNDVTPVTLIHSHDTSHGHEELHEDELKEITLAGIIKENEIVKDHKLDPVNKTFEEVLEIANENRPDLKTYLALKDASKESLKYTKRSWFPELSANAGYSYTRQDSTNINSLSYGADLSIPAVRPVGIKYEIDAANAELESANEDVRLIYQTVYYDVQLALCETKIHENQIPLVLNRIKLAKENFELADGRYIEGIGNYIELQDARSEYLNAQQEYINTVYEYGIARANLDFAMGVK